MDAYGLAPRLFMPAASHPCQERDPLPLCRNGSVLYVRGLCPL